MVDGYMKFKGLWCVGGVSQQKQSKWEKKFTIRIQRT